MIKDIGLIVACDEKRLIGVDNNLPWKIKEEMKFFKEKTINNIVIMGSKTYNSLNKPLENRLNFVITSKKIDNNKVFCFNDIFVCLDFCKKYDKKIFVIGGESIYRFFLENNLVNYMYISVIKSVFSCQGNPVYFPEIKEEFWDKDLFLRHELFDVYYYKKK